MPTELMPSLLSFPVIELLAVNGELVGYGGGLPMKKKLLDLEKSRHANLAFDF